MWTHRLTTELIIILYIDFCKIKKKIQLNRNGHLECELASR